MYIYYIYTYIHIFIYNIYIYIYLYIYVFIYYSNTNTILGRKISEVHPIIMYHVSAEAGMKVRVFTKDYFQNKLDDSSLDFTKSLINSESNTYYQTNPGTSGNINFSDWLKTLKEGNK